MYQMGYNIMRIYMYYMYIMIFPFCVLLYFRTMAEYTCKMFMHFVKFTDKINNTYVYLHVHHKHSFLPKIVCFLVLYIGSCSKTYYFYAYLVRS